MTYVDLNPVTPEIWYWLLFSGFILIVILGIYTLWTMSKEWKE